MVIKSAEVKSEGQSDYRKQLIVSTSTKRAAITLSDEDKTIVDDGCMLLKQIIVHICIFSENRT